MTYVVQVKLQVQLTEADYLALQDLTEFFDPADHPSVTAGSFVSLLLNFPDHSLLVRRVRIATEMQFGLAFQSTLKSKC